MVRRWRMPRNAAIENPETNSPFHLSGRLVRPPALNAKGWHMAVNVTKKHGDGVLKVYEVE